MKDILDQVAESTGAAAVSKGAIVAGSAGSVLFGYSTDVIGLIAAIIIGVLGLAYSVWSGERRLKILREQGKNAE